MTDKTPLNISLLSLPRAGSTSLLMKLTRAMKSYYGIDNVRKMGEAISSAGLFGVNHYPINKAWREGPEGGSADYLQWMLDHNSCLCIGKAHAFPGNEFDNRINLVKASSWSNHAVIKHLASAQTESVMDFGDALIAAGPKFHHVVLWRKDLAGLIYSRYVSDKTRKNQVNAAWHGHTSHGFYLWNGEYIGNPKHEYGLETFGEYTRDIVASYVSIAQRLPKDRTVLLETSSVDSVDHFFWPEGTVIDMSAPLPKKLAANTESN